MLAMMFNYINEETVMAGPGWSRVGSLFISRGERGEDDVVVRRQEWTHYRSSGSGSGWTEEEMVVVLEVVLSVCVGVSYWT